MPFALAGCEVATSAVGGVSDVVVEQSASPPAIEAGIVLADLDGYLCLPFERVGLPADASVVSITSSCECVEPRVIAYRMQQGDSANAVLLRFVNDDSSGAVAAELAVIITVTKYDGETLRFRVNLLHASLDTAV